MKQKKISILFTFVLFSLITYAQNKTVNGKILDTQGNPLENASIVVKGNDLGTVSDENGNFSLSIPPNSTHLIVTHINYGSKEVVIDSDNLTINLEAATNQDIEEVVVVGYGTKLKRDITSSISKISSGEFQNLPLPSVEQALQGRASGVFINSGSGKLGQGLNIRVRGISSISAGQNPFVVIDGVPVVNEAIGSDTEPDNPLASINPDDIESIEILKDASSSAIYGSRASNGVLLVTTKSGKKGKTKANFGFYTGISNPTKKQKFLNADQYRELIDSSAAYIGYTGAEIWDILTGTDEWTSNNNSNWVDETFQKGYVRQYNASVSGGDEKTRFLFSGNYNDQKGILRSNRLNKLNARVNVDHTINKMFTIGLNVSLNQMNNYRIPEDNAFSNPQQLNAIPPIQPVYNEDGTLNSNTIYYNNLFNYQGNNKMLSKSFRTISNAFIDVNLTSNLKFRTQNGIDYINLREMTILGRETQDGAPEGYSYDNSVTNSIFTTTNTLQWNNSFGNSDIDALAGIEYQMGNSSGASVEGRAFPNDRFTKIANAAIITSGSSTETEYRFLSYFARANYKLLNRYLIGGSVRADGSSRFGADNRFGVFPAASAGWIISEENFLKESNALSFLKVRTSYGKTGNAEIGNFSSRSLFTSAAYASIAGLVTSQIGDPNLSWENTTQFDVGLDFGFLNNRISGEIDYFMKNTKNLLLDIPLPSVNGYTTITKNIGDMENKGWEFVLNGDIIRREDMRWTVSFNISTYKNNVTRLEAPILPSSNTFGRLEVGSPYGEFYGKKYMGVDPQNGDALYLGENGTTTNDYSAAINTVIGDPNPDFYGGANTKFSYKGFDIDILTQFVEGGDIYNMAGTYQSANGDYLDNQTADQFNFWRKPGDITNIPQPRFGESNGTQKSSRWVQDGSYFRLKSLNLGYNFSKSLLSNLKMESLRVYVAAYNLLTFTKYNGYDPEINTTGFGALNLGHDFYTSPQAQTFTFGINVGL